MIKPRLLLLQMGDASPQALPENFDGLFLRMANYAGVELEIIHAAKGGKTSSPNNYAGVIVTGSPAMVTDREDWSEAAGRWLAGALEGGRCGILGICYGHQLLAQALGGTVGFHPGGMELGTHAITLKPAAEDYRLLSGLPKKFNANLSHSQTVQEAPAGAVNLASSFYEPNQILAYGDKVITLQFHPEFDAQVMFGYVQSRLLPGNNCSELASGLPRQVYLGLPVADTPVPALILQRFIDSCVQQA